MDPVIQKNCARHCTQCWRHRYESNGPCLHLCERMLAWRVVRSCPEARTEQPAGGILKVGFKHQLSGWTLHPQDPGLALTFCSLVSQQRHLSRDSVKLSHLVTNDAGEVVEVRKVVKCLNASGSEECCMCFELIKAPALWLWLTYVWLTCVWSMCEQHI